MNIGINNFFNHKYLSFVQEKIFYPLATQHKKIIAITSIAFGLLAVCYAIYSKSQTLNNKIDIVNGYGKKVYSDGRIEEGTFKNGLLNGSGKVVYTDGSEFKGEFKNGLLHGKGMKLFADQSTQYGEFKEGEAYILETMLPDGTLYPY